MRRQRLVLKHCIIMYAFAIIATTTPPATASITNGVIMNPTYNSMKTLHADLLVDYDTNVRPRRNLSETVVVNMTFTLISGIDFDVAGQKQTLMGYFMFMWRDHQILVWNSTSYDGIQMIQPPMRKVWTPNVLYSVAYDGKGNIKMMQMRLHIILMAMQHGRQMERINSFVK